MWSATSSAVRERRTGRTRCASVSSASDSWTRSASASGVAGSKRKGCEGTPYSAWLCSWNSAVPTAPSMRAVVSIAVASRSNQSSTTPPGTSRARASATASSVGPGSIGRYVGDGSSVAPVARKRSRSSPGQLSADSTRIGLAVSWRIVAARR
jgi:hypothetical protein